MLDEFRLLTDRDHPIIPLGHQERQFAVLDRRRFLRLLEQNNLVRLRIRIVHAKADSMDQILGLERLCWVKTERFPVHRQPHLAAIVRFVADDENDVRTGRPVAVVRLRLLVLAKVVAYIRLGVGRRRDLLIPVADEIVGRGIDVVPRQGLVVPGLNRPVDVPALSPTVPIVQRLRSAPFSMSCSRHSPLM